MKNSQKLIHGAKSMEKYSGKFLKFVNSKWFHRWLAFSFMIFFVLSITQTEAQSPLETCIDNSKAYELCPMYKLAGNYSAPVSEELDVELSRCNTINASANSLVMAGGLHFGCGHDAVLKSSKYDDVPFIAKHGIVGTLEQMNSALLTNPPTIDLVAHMSDEWVPGSDMDTAVYAQDGYAMLTAVNIGDLWQTTRMIAYSLFVIALIIAGFMIMFRQKIGGQMSVTIFNTIPKVIIGLILVTFSFAIVGIVIDIGAMLINVVASIFDLSNPVVISQPFTLVGTVFRGETGLGAVGVALGGGLAATLLGAVLIPFTGGWSAIVSGGGLLVSFVALAIIGIVAYASIKVFITLLKAWVGIIVDTILGPIFLVIAVIPGKSNVGVNWFYRIVKNVLVFVGVYAVVNLAIYLNEANVNFYFPSGLAGGDTTIAAGGIIPLIMNAVLPLFLFFMASEVPNFLDDIIPKDGGKGAATAFGNVTKSFSAIPVVGKAVG